ncbi:hypothetical protein QA645_37665 [Bradyrhizobium sp. CIAT3101]|uniref:hypothetical protein n=1 Tax=Bradyrhizobium sp. CIAT3101 TaxID=439387 RepID=UPI0024B0A038|nr:hypothetical protein [Bradyrhizobium sp. CIAT3101]WFU80168.1 hypothetical protein QA645_37665 [Bradyrhizobium sp. CIAT3101]
MPTLIQPRPMSTNRAARAQVERDRIEATVLFSAISLLTALIAVISNTQGAWF